MKLITGGAFQGKTEYAIKQFALSKDSIMDGETCDVWEISQAKCIINFHIIVKRILTNGENPQVFAKKMLEQNPDIIIITNEIGGGIIPLDKGERIWRETVGMVCCYLASKAETVIRINCGIPTILKETK